MIIPGIDKMDSTEIRRIWEEKVPQLSQDEKFQFLNEIIEKPWRYVKCRDIFSKLIFDLASPTRDFISILNLVSSKLAVDLVYPNMLLPIIEIGKHKKKIAQSLLEMIWHDTFDDRLIALSGHLLGGLYENNPEKFLSFLEDHIKVENKFLLDSYVKAFRIVLNSKTDISDRERKLVEVILERNFELVNIETIYLSIENYPKDPVFFFSILRRLADVANRNYHRAIFHNFSPLNRLSDDDVFALIDMSKNCDDGLVLTDIAHLMIKYPSRTSDIIHFIFYWIRQGTIWGVMNIDWICQEIGKIGVNVIKNYIDEYVAYCQELGITIEPILFEHFITADVDAAITPIIEKESISFIEKSTQLELAKKILGFCYKDYNHYPHLRKIMVFLVEKYRTTPFFENPFNEGILLENAIKLDQYISFVDLCAEFIERIENNRETYDFSFILGEIERYPTISKYGREILIQCKDTYRFSPLLQLIQPSEDMNSTNEWELRDIAWGQACLDELENGLKNFEEIPNTKYHTPKIKSEYLSDRFTNSKNFWSFFSESVVMNRFEPSKIIQKDVSYSGDSDLDFLIKLNTKHIFFEVTSTEMPRDLRISNCAEILKSRSFSIIDQKYKQLKKSGASKFIDDSNDYYFYIAIDEGQYPSSGEDIASALFGPLALSLRYDTVTKKLVENHITRNTKDGILVKNKNSKYISGVIFFKTTVVQESGKHPCIQLTGNIINNSIGKNVLPEPELSELRKCLFGDLVEN